MGNLFLVIRMIKGLLLLSQNWYSIGLVQKQITVKRNFDQLLRQVEHEEREINAFLEVYRQHAYYQKKVAELKDKEKDLEF